MADAEVSVPDLPEEAYPAYVLTEAERERWRVAHAIAAEISRQNEPTGDANSQFVWYFTRTLYQAEMPTGRPDDLTPQLLEAELVEARADSILEQLERAKPAADASEAEHWKHVGRICDVLDRLFGTPDELDAALGDHVGKVDTGGDELVEAFEHVVRGAYRSDLHPRDRAGKWARTLHAVRSFARANADKVKGAFAQEEQKGEAGAARLRARAAAERTKRVARGAKEVAVQTHHHVYAHSVIGLANVYSAKSEEKLGMFHENLKDPMTTLDTADRAAATSDLMHEAARWAIEHHEELSTVMQVARAGGAAALHLIAGEDDQAEADDADALLEGLLA